MADLDIAAFLRARLDDLEKPLHEIVRQLDAYAASDDDTGIDGGWSLWGSFGASVDAAFKPREQLADVAAKRKILAMHKHTATRAGDRLIEHCSCQNDWDTIFGRYWPCDTLSLFAMPYAGHPDYREEWRP